MKALKNIWMFCIIALLNACTTEDIIESSGSTGINNETTTAIGISLDNLLPVNMNSRATIDDLLSQIKDLNIRVTIKPSDNSKEKYAYIYCLSNGEIKVDGKTVDASKAYNIDGKTGYIHCNDIAAVQVKKVQVIANYGSDLYNNKDWESVVEKDNNNLLSQEYCMMYGETDSSIRNEHNGQASLNCQLFTVKLKRTRAMLTVALQGTEDLKPGVSITPKKISLHNIPVQCSLLSENKATDIAHKNGEPQDINWGTITRGVTAGAHADKDLPTNFLPLYLFENLGGTTTNTDKVKKYPEGCAGINDAKKNETHSYVEIEADYRYEENGFLKNSGTIVYRFFLGGNDFNDFNVRRNVYYRLTLRLKGFGGAKEDGKVDNDGKLVVNNEDLSWRVDMNIRDWGFEKDEYDFDAHGTLGIMKVMGSEWKVKGSGTSGGNSFIKFWSGDIMDSYWVEPTNVGKCGTEDGILYFYIQPWAWTGSGSDGFNDDALMDKSNSSRRKITITLSNGSDEQTVTFYQWKPITIVNGRIYMERFEEDNPFEWGYQGESISDINNTSLTLKQMWNAVGKMPNSPAQVYCKEKGSYGSIADSKKEEYGLTGQYDKYPSPSGNNAEYCLPDMNTLLQMQKYCEDHPHSNNRDDENYYQPLELSEGYWSVSTNNQETYFLDANGQQSVTSARSSAKRVRAIYTVKPW